MRNDMLAARHLGRGDLQLQPLPRLSAKPGWIVVEPKALGICGTDTHIHAGEFPAAPVTLGHEIAGVIVEVGDGIDDLAVRAGAPTIVVVEPNPSRRDVAGTVINPYTQAQAIRLLDRLPLDQMPIETVRVDEVGAAFNGSLDHATKDQIAPI